MTALFDTFVSRRVPTSGAEINLVVGGSGPPLLLLHGYPQTHAIWHRVAPTLARSFTVVCPDLRGYGDSEKPDGGVSHVNYSKRVMAQDQVEVMESLGFSQFAVAGHDRGGRVAHRMAVDHPDTVKRLAVLDISPTRLMYDQTDKAFATAYYHWFFLIQPFDLPERLIGADPSYYLRRKLGGLSSGLQHFDPRALAEYERCFADPATIHATCEDYRAAATIDLDHDAVDRDVRIRCPVLVLWGQKGVVHRLFSPIDDWKSVADDVRGKALPCGHFLAEELPDETIAELLAFLANQG
jgi:haloacetate dehalogenase